MINDQNVAGHVGTGNRSAACGKLFVLRDATVQPVFDLIRFNLKRLFSLLTGITVLIQELNSLTKKRSTPLN